MSARGEEHGYGAAFSQAPYPLCKEYFGGKSTIAKLVWERLGDCPNTVDPFFGSNAFLLGRPGWDWHKGCRKDGEYRTETVSDADGLVCNFWRAIKVAPDKVAFYADWPVNECVPAGTMVATPDGELPIEEVGPGMVVLGRSDGNIAPVIVMATKRSTAQELYHIGPLSLTGNHPVWTVEHGYLPASQLTGGLHIARLHWGVDETDLVVLESGHERTRVANLHTRQPRDPGGTVRRGDVPEREAPVQPAPITSCHRRQGLPGLLDKVDDSRGLATFLSGGTNRPGCRLADSRTELDRTLPPARPADQSDRWRRWDNRLHTNTGASSEVVRDATGDTIPTRTQEWDVWEAPYTRGRREDSTEEQGALSAGGCQSGNLGSPQGESNPSRAAGSNERRPSWKEDGRGSETEDHPEHNYSEASPLRRNGRDIPICQGNMPSPERPERVGQPGTPEGLPLQGPSPSIPIPVYNLQTTSGNYFANRILVHNCDLHARHSWLTGQRVSLTAQLEGEPYWCDVKAAGWWVWGMSIWIGGEFASGKGPWHVEDGKLVKSEAQHDGIQKRRPDLGRKGVSHKLPDLSGRGIARQLPNLSGRGVTGARRIWLQQRFKALSARLQDVRVCCGDWTRVLTYTPTTYNGLTAVFLDPPYAQTERDATIYSVETNVSKQVREWAIEHGHDPLLRIALCGYDGEHQMPPDWTEVPWVAQGGYANLGQGKGANNRSRERLWFSPHCLNSSIRQMTIFDLLEAESADVG